MLKTTYRKHGVRLTHVYFAQPEEIESGAYLKNCGDLVFLHGTDTEPKGGTLYTVQHTLIKDLTLPEEEIFAGFGKHLRKHIHRSEKENLVRFQRYDSEEILRDERILESCKFLYEKMFADKGMKVGYNTKLSKQFCRQNALFIMLAFLEDQPVGYSAIIADNKNARAWTSAFDFRNQKMDAQVLSRAHKRLNWERMRWMKSLGVAGFDFGGVNSFTDPNEIAEFKMDFGTEWAVTYQNYLVPRTLLGKAALKFFVAQR